MRYQEVSWGLALLQACSWNGSSLSQFQMKTKLVGTVRNRNEAPERRSMTGRDGKNSERDAVMTVKYDNDGAGRFTNG
jgi:hypothetical protein